MGRMLAIDFGLKRSGIAVTDPLRIIATPLVTIATDQLESWIDQYFNAESVDTLVIGKPTRLDQSPTHTTVPVQEFEKKMRVKYPDLKIVLVDERFTSKIAQQTMIMGGMKKKDRRNKSNVDKISAAIILQSYMSSLS